MPIYNLGIDLGTTSIKVSVVNVETNEIEDHYTQNTNCELPVDIKGAHEQYVPKIIETLNLCVERIKLCYRESIRKIGVCGQMHGVLFWNTEDGVKPWKYDKHTYSLNENKVSKLFTWQDGRCDQQFLSTLPIPDSHLGISTGFGIPTIFWLKRNEPEYLQKYNHAGLISSFVVAMLCDQELAFTSYQNAASWGYFNCREYKWNLNVLTKADFPIALLPEVKPGGTFAGTLTKNWYGIPAGVSVGVDLGDLQCSVISSIDTLQDALINVSTSAQVAFVVYNYTPPIGSPKIEPLSYWPYFSNMYVVVAASLNGGNVLVFFINMLESWFSDLEVTLDKEAVWKKLIELGLRENSESNLNIKPTCMGERFNPTLTASVTNITGLNLSLGQVFRALCRGLIDNLHSQLSAVMLKQSKCNRIVGNGSGLYKNPILQMEVERIYKLPLVFTHVGDASKGAAMAMYKYSNTESSSSSSPSAPSVPTSPLINKIVPNYPAAPVPTPAPIPTTTPIPTPAPTPAILQTRTGPIAKPCQCPPYCKCSSKVFSKNYSMILD